MADIRDFSTYKGKKDDDNPSEIKQALVAFLENAADLMEFKAEQAKLKKNYFDHLVKSGFTETQALDIVKSDPHM
ncbi:hypothetical protein AB1K91_17820 [Terribacillus sp. 179-K 1B1 HS]|uniref:hypothetical protein n=1 Tax=Terribacillus sp. 179-K 1B1 HS TaxID=3142388 RepID=UPI0039A31559